MSFVPSVPQTAYATQQTSYRVRTLPAGNVPVVFQVRIRRATLQRVPRVLLASIRLMALPLAAIVRLENSAALTLAQ